jgi:hypothetical protein
LALSIIKISENVWEQNAQRKYLDLIDTGSSRKVEKITGSGSWRLLHTAEH